MNDLLARVVGIDAAKAQIDQHLLDLHRVVLDQVRISADRGRSFQPIVDGISDERGRRFSLNVDDLATRG